MNPINAFDLHCDTAQLIRKGYDLREEHKSHHIDLPRMVKAGIKWQVFAFFSLPFFWRRNFFKRILNMISSFKNHINNDNLPVNICLTKNDLIEKRSGTISALLGVEGGHQLDNSLKMIDEYFKQGIRIFTLTWNNSNFLATSCKDNKQKKTGLTKTGIEAVKKMNRLGMAVDLSHSGEKTFWDVLDISEKPPFTSHSCSYELCPVPRNLKDEQAKALAGKGGIIGINFYKKFLRKDWHKAGITDVAKHIIHFCDIIGPDNISLGADYDGISHPPIGLENVSLLPALAEYLIKAGITQEDLEKIFYKNALRYFEKVLP